MATSPTQLTLRELRKQGYTAAVVERWNQFSGRRQDLFGFIDVLGVGPDGTIAVQATSYANVSARVRKIGESEHIGAVREAGWRVVVWGRRKPKHRWIYREVDIS